MTRCRPHLVVDAKALIRRRNSLLEWKRSTRRFTFAQKKPANLTLFGQTQLTNDKINKPI